MTKLTDKKLLAKAWEDFFVLGIEDNKIVSKDILDSWKRSKENNVNYLLVARNEKDEDTVKELKLKNHAFIDISKPYMDDLYEIINDTNFMISLIDKDGYVLEAIVHPKLIEKTKFNSLNLSEKRVGTNAMGTCLYLDRPFQTYGEEHCHRFLHKFTTSAAPIHDINGDILGCIGITGFQNYVSVHTLGMATAVAYAIENKIKSSQEKQNLLVKSYSHIINYSNLDGIIILDKCGIITSVNKTAENILLMKNEEMINNYIGDILKASISFQEYIKNDTENLNIPVVFKKNNRNIHCNLSFIPLKSDSELMGFIIMVNNDEKPSDKERGDLYSFEDIIGNSNIIKEAINISKIAAEGSSNILIMGESGTGKELFAQSIHNNSERKDKPFIDINCGALPASLAESELFGYEGGSYTGARKEGQPGKFELANGGTIFLDEIGELPLSMQASLLRVIQERKVRRIGGNKSIDIDIMIIAATNRDLFKAVQENTFRGDLFYRLNVFTINLPGLRDHKEDIVLLVEHFIRIFNVRFKKNILGIDKEVLNALLSYQWPGNIRELENIIERSIQLARKDFIVMDDLPAYIRLQSENKMEIEENVGLIDMEEKRMIINWLNKNEGNINKTSKILGISRATLYRKIERYNINIEDYRN